MRKTKSINGLVMAGVASFTALAAILAAGLYDKGIIGPFMDSPETAALNSPPMGPEYQNRMVELRKELASDLSAAQNEMQKAVAIRQYDLALCAALTGLNFENWTGTLVNVMPYRGGPFIVIRSEAGEFYGDYELDHASPEFIHLSKMESGDPITFSGQFFQNKENCINQRKEDADLFHTIRIKAAK